MTHQPIKPTIANTLATGFAMFSMFFGAGNVVFPLAVGQYAQDKNIYAVLGLLITTVLVPFTGLIAMTLFNGNHKHFFERIGKVPGFILAAAIMGLIGPFGAIPRCITLSYSTIKIYWPELSLIFFSILSCVVIYVLTFRRNNVLNILGYVLTPILLGSLAIIIVKGILSSPTAITNSEAPWNVFIKGLMDGSQTMDLMGAFFFSSVVLDCLERDVDTANPKYYRKMMILSLKASIIGAGLLAITYIGFSYLAAFNSEFLAGVSQDKLAGSIANLVLGPYAGLIACVLVALACLTTAIALAAVFAEFIHKDVTANKVSYELSLLGTLVISFFISTLQFTGIIQFLAPILHLCYPALITLSILNILHKLYHIETVKLPVFVVFVVSLLVYAMM